MKKMANRCSNCLMLEIEADATNEKLKQVLEQTSEQQERMSLTLRKVYDNLCEARERLAAKNAAQLRDYVATLPWYRRLFLRGL